MQRAAHKAAPRLRRDFGEVEQLQVSRKGPADFVSLADKRAEATIVEELRTARPDWGMLLEGGGELRGRERARCVAPGQPPEGLRPARAIGLPDRHRNPALRPRHA